MMTKSFFTSLLFLGWVAVPSFAMAQNTPSPEPFSKYIWGKRLHLFFGIDPEKTDNQLIDNIYLSSTVNAGVSYQIPVNANWSVGPEFWSNQYATPRLTLIQQFKTNLDAQRITVYDTASVIRMAGYYAGATLTRQLPHGFSVTGGVGCGWYRKGITEYASSVINAAGEYSGAFSSGYAGNDDLPDWFEGVQPGVKLRVDKTFLQRLVIGASVQQSLKDMTKFSDDSKNLSTNFLVYVGVRI